MKSPTESENTMFIVTTIATESCGEYFDGEPFTIGDRCHYEFDNWTDAAKRADWLEAEGFDVTITERAAA